jgi:hypothetical protein
MARIAALATWQTSLSETAEHCTRSAPSSSARHPQSRCLLRTASIVKRPLPVRDTTGRAAASRSRLYTVERFAVYCRPCIEESNAHRVQ